MKTDRSVNSQRNQGRVASRRLFGHRGLVKKGFVIAFALFGAATSAASFGQTVQTVATPWVGQNGREIVDLNAASKGKALPRKAVKRANPIRQTQALSTPVNPLDDANFPADLPDQSLGETFEELSQPIDSVLEATPIANTQDSPVDVAEPLGSAPPMPTVAPSRLEATDAPKEPVKDYPRGDVVNAERNVPANAVNAPGNSNYPAYSTNPYARIGKAEYHPNQFYGRGGNYTVNGYRQTPPAVAYGQSLCGEPCVGNSCACFGGFFQNTELEARLDGMRSALDFEDSGNFGGDFAINWGSVQPILGGFHVQAGARGVFTDLNGEWANGFERSDCRSQVFWTAGLYYRGGGCSDGWTLGVVYDSLTDKYYREYDLQQLRAELAYNFVGIGEIGFKGAFALNDDWCDFVNYGFPVAQCKATATNYYTLFYRKQFDQGATATIYGGATEWSEGLAGFSIEAPLSNSFSVKCGGSCVFGKKRNADIGLEKFHEENWNLSLGVVWRLGGNACVGNDTSRPLFDVADNGSFLQNFLRD